MGKALPAVAAASALLTAVGVVLFPADNGILLVYPALAAVGSVLAFLARRGGLSASLGIALASAALLGLLAASDISWRKNDLSAVHDTLGSSFMVASGLLVAAAATWLGWDAIAPPWLRSATAVAAALGFAIVLLTPEDTLGQAFASNLGWLAPGAALSLAAAAGPVRLLRAPRE